MSCDCIVTARLISLRPHREILRQLAGTMSNFALACDLSGRWGTPAAPRRKLTTVRVPWKEVVVGRVEVPPAQGGPSRWLLGAIIAALAVSIHGGVVWYVSHLAPAARVPPRKHEVEVQLLQPPKPLPPKI